MSVRTLHTRIGAGGRVGFAAADQVRSVLGVEPGALTPLGIINDQDGLVSVVIDAALIEAEQLNFHPLVQTLSVGLRPADLLAFLASCDRQALMLDFSALSGPA